MYTKFKNITKRQNIYFVSLFFVLIGFSQHTFGQTKGLIKEYKRIETLIEDKKYESAEAIIDSFVQVKIEESDWPQVYQCQWYLYTIGNKVYSYEDVYPKSKIYYNNIPTEDTIKSRSAKLLAYMAQWSGYDKDIIDYYRVCIKGFTKTKSKKNLRESYANLAVHYMKLNDHESAIKNMKACLLQLKDLSRQEMPIKYISKLSSAYFNNQNYSQAVKTIEEYRTYPNSDSRLYNYRMSTISLAQGNLTKANIYHDKAVAVLKSSRVKEYNLKILKAKILLQESKYTEAIDILLNAEKNIPKIRDLREHGKLYILLVQAYEEISNWENAYIYLEKSWNSFCKNSISLEEYKKIRENRYLYNELYIPDLVKHLGNYYDHLFETTNLEKYRTEKVACIDIIIESLNYKKSLMESIGGRQNVSAKFTSYYEEFILSLLNWYKTTGKIKYLDKTLEVAQKYNSFQLKQLVNERVVLRNLNVDSILAEQYMKAQLLYQQKGLQLDMEFTNDKLSEYKNLEESFNRAKDKIIEKHPQFQELKNDFTTLSLVEIQSRIEEKTALIKYFTGPNKIVSFAITKDQANYYIHDNANTINQEASELRKQILNYSLNRSKIDSMEVDFMNTSYSLSKNIILNQISGLPQEIEKLIILPSGSLKQIPFEALVVKPMKKWSNSEAFLLNDYAVSYAYYCKQALNEKISKDMKTVMAYGLEYDEFTLNSLKLNKGDSVRIEVIEKFRSSKLSHTYFADDEAIEVAEMFNGKHYVNENATKENFFKSISDFDIIHISAHSFVDIKEPEKSSIILHKKDKFTDNLIKMKDVLEIDLGGKFVTLSACNTFYGKNNESEGLESMAKSFTESGADAVLGSFWPVPDEISKSFMTSFYSHLKSGLPKDEALRATKLQFMNDDDLYSPMYRAPFYWSAWILYGDTDQLVQSKAPPFYLYALLLFTCIAFIIHYKTSLKKILK